MSGDTRVADRGSLFQIPAGRLPARMVIYVNIMSTHKSDECHSGRWLDLSIALILLLITVSLYWPATGFEFINSDDGLYVYENQVVKRGLTLKGGIWALTSLEAANWHPITWLSHMADVELFGMNAGGHHFTNLALHTLNAILLLFLMMWMTGARWPSVIVAALFALHPLHVESVIWVSERKDVLSTFFWILATLAYTGYARKPGVYRYLAVLILFLLGIMTKPMLVTLPFVFLLLDFWPLGRVPHGGLRSFQHAGQRFSIRRLVYEKLPLFIVSAVSCWVTWIAQAGSGAIKTMDLIPFSVRVTNAVISYATYLAKIAWPYPLAFHYPLHTDIPWGKFFFAVLLLITITLFAGLYARRFPYIITGWLWYLGTLVPVIGIVQVGTQAMADRYTYIPLTGVFFIIAWGWLDLTVKRRILLKWLSVVLVIGWISGLSVVTRHQIHYWKDSISLLGHTLGVTTGNYGAHSNLGLALSAAGRQDEAIEHFHRALEINPRFVQAINNLGQAYEKKGRRAAAVEQYLEAIRIDPRFADARYNLGNIFAQQGLTKKAVEHYRLALQSRPADPEILNNLGTALAAKGESAEAVRLYRKALEISPDAIKIKSNLGATLFRQGQLEAARNIFKEIVASYPGHADAYYSIGYIYEKQGHLAKASLYYEKTLRIDPGHQKARLNLQRIRQSLQS